MVVEPDQEKAGQYAEAFNAWKQVLEVCLANKE
jgi:hypothetical protein